MAVIDAKLSHAVKALIYVATMKQATGPMIQRELGVGRTAGETICRHLIACGMIRSSQSGYQLTKEPKHIMIAPLIAHFAAEEQAEGCTLLASLQRCQADVTLQEHINEASEKARALDFGRMRLSTR